MKTLRRTSLLLLAILSTTAWSWKAATHVATGNQVLKDLGSGGSSPISSGATSGRLVFNDPLTGRHLEVDISKTEAIQAIKAQPRFFRAGLIGPDGFADMVSGQTYQHGNETPLAWEGLEYLKTDGPTSDYWSDYQVPIKSPSRNPLESRTQPSKYRSIDYAMSMLQFARESYLITRKRTSLFGGTTQIPPDPVEVQRVIAFIVGYIGHCVGDAFGHTYVNEYANGAWSYVEGSGLFGPETEEIKHVVLEGFIDHRLPGDLENADGSKGGAMNQMKIEAPIKFLTAFFSSREPGAQTVGDQSQDIDAFMAYYSNADQFRGGAFYNLYNMQVDAADHLEEWAGVEDYLDWVDALDPAVGVMEYIDNLVEGAFGVIPGVDAAQDFANYAKGDLLEWLTGGLLNCATPEGGDMFDVWNYFADARSRIGKWKDKSSIVRENWQRMSQCTAENLAKLEGGKYDKNDPIAKANFTDACAEMARASWADEATATSNSLSRGSIRTHFYWQKTNGETEEQEFLRELKQAFLGDPAGGKTFEENNRHRTVSGNIERAYSYLLGTSITIDELKEVILSGKMEIPYQFYCDMARYGNSPERNCFNVSKRVELSLLMTGFCAYDAAVKSAKCYTDAVDVYRDCLRLQDNMCDRIPDICTPRWCPRKIWGWRPPCIGGCMRNYPLIYACKGQSYLSCAGYDVVVTGACQVDRVIKLGVCEGGALYNSFLTWDPFDSYFRKLAEVCDYVDEGKRVVEVYKQYDTPEEREAFLRSKGVPIDQVRRYRDVMAKIADKLREKPDVYALNLVFLKEDLKDPQYFALVQAQIQAKIAEWNAKPPSAEREENLRLLNELRQMAVQINTNQPALYKSFDDAEFATSLADVQNPSSRNSLATKKASMDQIFQKAVANPRDALLPGEIQTLEADIKAIPPGSPFDMNSGYEQRQALLKTVTDMRLFVEAVTGSQAVSFNNFPMLQYAFSSTLSSATNGLTRVERVIDLSALPEIAGPTASRVLSEIGVNYRTTFTPFYNTVQGVKVGAIQEKQDVEGLFLAKSVSTNFLPWKNPKDLANVSLYSKVCSNPSMLYGDMASLYCDVLRSNDDPNCVNCVTSQAKGPKPLPSNPDSWNHWYADNLEEETIGVDASGNALNWTWGRGAVVWSRDGKSNVKTNFPLASTDQARTALYENIFRTPGACGTITLGTLPSHLEFELGQTATLTVSATGPTNLYYEWKRNGVTVSTGAQSSYTIPSFSEADAGVYTVTVTAACGTTVSSSQILVSVAASTDLYVDDDAAPGGNGRSWLSPFRTLDEAMLAARTGVRIHVAKGTYAPSNSAGTFEFPSGVTLLGGYAEDGDARGRDPVTDRSVLSGGSRATLTTNFGQELLVEGFTFTGGSGFAVETNSSDWVKFYQCDFSRTWNTPNSAVLGLWEVQANHEHGKVQLEEVRILGSTTDYAIANNGVDLSMHNVKIIGNHVKSVLFNFGNTSLSNVLIAANSVSSQGSIVENHATLDLSFSTIAGNSVDGSTVGAGPVGISMNPGSSLTGASAIIWDGTFANGVGGNVGSASLTNSCVKGGLAGAGNISDDPMLLSDYHPAATSPVVDKGDVQGAGTQALDGNWRDATPDMGAYEHHSAGNAAFQWIGQSLQSVRYTATETGLHTFRYVNTGTSIPAGGSTCYGILFRFVLPYWDGSTVSNLYSTYIDLQDRSMDAQGTCGEPVKSSVFLKAGQTLQIELSDRRPNSQSYLVALDKIHPAVEQPMANWGAIMGGAYNGIAGLPAAFGWAIEGQPSPWLQFFPVNGGIIYGRNGGNAPNEPFVIGGIPSGALRLDSPASRAWQIMP